jgi:ABC-type sulfate transport system permease component
MVTGIFSKLIGGSIGEMAEGVANAIDRFVETGEEKKAAELLLLKMQQEPDKWQAQINMIEAQHRSVFVSGWRPSLGWLCSFGIGWVFIVAPITQVVFQALGTPIIMPEIATGELMTLVFAMLGLGGLRSYEKKHNLTK